MSETVTITMTRDHAQVVQDACEMLMRMKLGQTINGKKWKCVPYMPEPPKE